MSHRLFFAIRPPRPIRDKLRVTMVGIDNARWQDDSQLHLTLRYVGEVETHLADDLADAAAQIRFEPFELRVTGIGFFESKGMARSLHAVIDPAPGLLRLQRKVERACAACGLDPETRRYTPHVTLARLNSASGPLAPVLARHTALALGPWRVDDYILYESTLREQGSLYEPIVTYPARTA